MKKLICIMITAALIFTPMATAYAKNGKDPKDHDKHNKHKTSQGIKEKKQAFKLKGKPVVKYGQYKLPKAPITKGMEATVKYDEKKAVLTVTQGTTKIVIDFINKTATVNGVVDTNSGIFTAKNDKKTIVLIQYIAKVLGVKVDLDDDDIIVETPGLDAPWNVTVTPVGTVVVPNALNTTTAFMIVSANIKAGQATGGKAELYVGSKLVAVDTNITATDTTVNFTTSDQTPTNDELKALVPSGGVVSVKLYNSAGKSVVSKTGNPTLIVDYSAPVLTSITSAIYTVSGGSIYVNTTGAGAVGDTVDVTKFTFHNASLGSSYQLTNAAGTGSTGVVTSENLLTITLGSLDKQILNSLTSSALTLYVAPGTLLKDTAGNTFGGFSSYVSVPVTVFK